MERIWVAGDDFAVHVNDYVRRKEARCAPHVLNSRVRTEQRNISFDAPGEFIGRTK
jgi:hypothetical protein